jgi:YfiH family protein
VASSAGGSWQPVREVHWVDQVHGSAVLVAAPRPGGEVGRTGSSDAVRGVPAGPGDALVSDAPSLALAILTADCASIALGSPEGVFGAVHAGWRGLVAGVVEEAVAAMWSLGATGVVGALGPCIHPECYEFSEPDLDQVAARYGPAVRGRTSSGRSALDLPAAVSASLAGAGVRQATEVVAGTACTACAGGYFSHRARRDRGRQALVVWSAAQPGAG